MATVQVDGLPDLIKGLEDLKLTTEKGVIRRGLIEALQPFDEAWRANAPVLTGALEESGGVGTRLTRRQRADAEENRQSFVEVHAGPGANPQAIQSEFGNAHEAARPFVRPAWDATQGQVQDRVIGALKGQLAKTQARAAARAARLAAKNASGS
jgi:HK97 gp10 family phage protein